MRATRTIYLATLAGIVLGLAWVLVWAAMGR
ncbi:hypothetical protein Xcel_1405 [Xylanimonas cellulosilytica DSM 15894]|uniref:Uncharacterized protein n=1 Tax=Xylanimonas cellulosilytica (strain DSM 15894 / JCM 12276 / CECT 5975 / KCTC 9989 / LMG 20990 / NBRC 107835 / XIL07) TaxID=446471 RepID=D1BRI1_XYLCX|nr:hypothetical protein Xcel_1405 [Xylanimonas cellulosilytica DSM 15894]